jgi:type I site-specific restriction endonuclease
LIKSAVSAKRKVFFVFGGTKGEQRDSVRTLVETETDAIIIASSGVFSTGINIKNLHNIIFTSPSKSKIRNLQSIGRGLRVSDTKTTCTLFDIGDDFEYNGKMNYTMRHMLERVKYYNQENFDYKIYKIDMEKQNER